MVYEATASEHRRSLEIAQHLAKMAVCFVVMPVFYREDFTRLAKESDRRLNELAKKVEASNA